MEDKGLAQTVDAVSPASGCAAGTPSLPIWRVRSYGFDDRFWQAKTARAARWRDYKAAREAGYWSGGFTAYLADSRGVDLLPWPAEVAGDLYHYPFIPLSALLPPTANEARPAPADGNSLGIPKTSIPTDREAGQ